MTRRLLSLLVVLNAVLLAAVATMSVTMFGASPANAQFGGGANYRMISGQVTGRSDLNAVYVIDLNTTRMLAIMYDSRTGDLTVEGSTTIEEDVRDAGGGR